MSEHVGNPGTASGWALHHYLDTEMCVDCGWWAHTVQRPKKTGPNSLWARDHASRALRALFPEEADEMLRRRANDCPPPDRATATKAEHTRWRTRLRDSADRRLAHRHETAHSALVAILDELWVERLAA